MAGLVNKLLRSLFILNIHICIVLGTIHHQKSILKVDRLEICYKSSDAPTRMNYFIMKYTKDFGYSLDLDVDILRDIDSDKIWGVIKVERCASREALDTCEPFAVLKPPIHICHFLDAEGMGVGSVMKSFNPPPKCPFKKGKIVGENVVFNPDLFTLFPITGVYWKIRAEGGEGKIHYYTVCFEGNIIPNRGQRSYNITAN